MPDKTDIHKLALAVADGLLSYFSRDVNVVVNEQDGISIVDSDGGILGTVTFEGDRALVRMRGSTQQQPNDNRTFEISDPSFPDTLYEFAESYWQPKIFLRGYKLKAIAAMEHDKWTPTETLTYFIKSICEHPVLGRLTDAIGITLLTIDCRSKQSVKDWIEGFS